MKYIRQFAAGILLLCFVNFIILFHMIYVSMPLKILIFICLLVFYVYYQIKPGKDHPPSRRLQFLINGYRLLIMGISCFMTELILYVLLLAQGSFELMVITNGIVAVLLLFILMANGFIRTVTTSTQLGITRRVLFLLFWWVPAVNLIFLYRICRITKDEYDFTCRKHYRNLARKTERVCKTQYPILLVHGIFFRDWEVMNYWGRIPAELIENGARIFYGKQQSALTVEQSALELKKRIFEILKETGSSRVNIIAHSKGGLDARYAISCLGMADQVASLTTISTPHAGCKFTDRIIEKVPVVINVVGKTYEGLYRKLGDHTPDFFSGLQELTVEKCQELNRIMPDCEGVFYQSLGSKMSSKASAAFPLNVGYSIIQPLDGDNDGLVSTASTMWKGFTEILESPGKRGISHGDMIDLTRLNIKGFDVCEFYVQLVYGLKVRGL